MSLFTPEMLNIDKLPWVAYTQRKLLPSIPAVYFVLASMEPHIAYIGATKCLRSRFFEERHDKHYWFRDVVPDPRIAWLSCESREQSFACEKIFLLHWKPILNGYHGHGWHVAKRLYGDLRASQEVHMIDYDRPRPAQAR
jgi:hypothetical protein